MLKNRQFHKIILVIFIINILIICGLGVFFLHALNIIQNQVQTGQVILIQEVRSKIIGLLGITGIVLAFFGIVIAIILSKYVIYPINKLIKSAETITEDDKNIKNLWKNKKKNETQNLGNEI